MAFNATEFRKQFTGIRPATANYFSVSIVPPKIFETEFKARLNEVTGSNVNWSLLFRVIEFRCEITQMPGRVLQTQRREVNGPGRDIPVSFAYNTIQLSFIENSDFSIRHMLDQWQEMIVTQRSNRRNDVLYYDDIISPTIIISTYSPKGDIVKTYELKDAYPISIAPQSLAWNMSNLYVSTAVEFSYHHWQTHNFNTTSSITQNSTSVPILGPEKKFAAAAQDVLLNTTKLNPNSITNFTAGLQDRLNLASEIAKFDESGFASGIVASSQDLLNRAQNLSLEGMTTIQEYALKALTTLATGQDVVEALKQQARIDSTSILGSIGASAQDIANRGLITVAENLPYPLDAILQPAGQALIDRKLKEGQTTVLKKLSKFL